MNIQEGTGTILLVDDESVVLEVGEQFLIHLGYTVFTAGTGAEAVEIVLQHAGNIDLLILDMAMPCMSGSETFDEIKKIKADMKILLMSGYNRNGEAQRIMDRGCNGFIRKPFSLEQLSHKIASILHENDSV